MKIYLRNYLMTELRVPDTDYTKSLSIEVRCVYEKTTSTVFNQQVTWEADNIQSGSFPKNNLKIIGFGNFKDLFSLKGYTDETFLTEKDLPAFYR